MVFSFPFTLPLLLSPFQVCSLGAHPGTWQVIFFACLCFQCLCVCSTFVIFLHHVYYSLHNVQLNCHSINPLSILLRNNDCLFCMDSYLFIFFHATDITLIMKVISPPSFPKTEGFLGCWTFSVKTSKVLGKLGHSLPYLVHCNVTQYHESSMREWIGAWNLESWISYQP